MPPAKRAKQGQCRFCLEDDTLKNLLAPCICKGSFKYVHLSCLTEWYEHEPVKGLRCSACLEPFSRQGMLELEVLPTDGDLQTLFINKPYLAILFSHWCFIGCNHFIVTMYGPIHYLFIYHIFQIAFHGTYMWSLHILFSQIKNIDVFMKEWMTRSIQIVPFIHVYCLATMWKTGFLGGIAADMCLFLYIYEIFDVLHTINQQQTFVFINRDD